MANTNLKTAEPITVTELRAFADQLDSFLVVLRKAEAEASKQPGEMLCTYGIPSGRNGIERLRTFIRSLDVSRYQASLGTPIPLGTQRNKRAPAKVATKKKVASRKKKASGD
jgi:hypothetical protein